MSGGWGSFGWGAEPWGTSLGAVEQPRWRDVSPWAARAVPSDTEYCGQVQRAWPDVTLLIGSSTRTADTSQRETDLTARGTYAASEASSARTAIATSGHAVYHSVITSTDGGASAVLIQHGPTSFASYGYRLYCDTADIVLEWASGSYAATLASVIDLSNDDEFIVSFTVRPNPDTTGATDAVLVELQAYNVTDDTYHRAPMVAGGAFGSSGSDTLMVGGRWDGASADREMGQLPVDVRIGTAPRAFAAVCDEFVAPASWSSFDQWDQWRPGPMLPAALAAEGEWFGPQPGVAASATQHVRRRCMGAIHNHIWPSEVPASINGDTFGDSGSILAGQLAYIPNSTRYVLPLTTIVQLYPHTMATRIRGRIYVEAQDVSGASVVVPVVGVRLVCIDRLPGAPGAIWKSGDAVSSAIASLAGEWFDLPPVEIVRAQGIGLPGSIGTCCVGVAIAIDPGDILSGAQEADWQWRIRALCTWQYTGDGDGIESLPLSPGYGGGFGGSTGMIDSQYKTIATPATSIDSSPGNFRALYLASPHWAGAVSRSQDAAVAGQRKILGVFHLAAIGEWLGNAAQPGSGGRDYPDRTTERRIGGGRAHPLPGHGACVRWIFVPSGPTEDAFVASLGTYGESQIEATWNGLGATTASPEVTTTAPGSQLTYSAPAQGWGSEWARAQWAFAPSLSIGNAALDSIARIYSEWPRLDTQCESIGTMRLISCLVQETPTRTAQLHTDNDVSVHAAAGGTWPHTGPRTEQADGLVFEDHRHGTERLLAAGQKQLDRVGPLVCQWSAWSDHTATTTQATQTVSISTTTDVMLWDTSVTAYDASGVGMMAPCYHAIRFDERALMPVTVAVCPVRISVRYSTTSGTGILTVHTSERSACVMTLPNKASIGWETYTTQLEVMRDPADTANVVQVFARRGTASAMLISDVVIEWGAYDDDP